MTAAKKARAARWGALLAGASLAAVACSFVVPFSEYDKDFGKTADAAPDALPEAAPFCEGGGCACDADLDLDPLHCGACDHDCLGHPCEAGMCAPEALLIIPLRPGEGITALAVEDPWVYVAATVKLNDGGTSGVLVRLKNDGTEPRGLTGGFVASSLLLTAADPNIYVRVAALPAPGIARTPKEPPVSDASFNPVTGLTGDPYALAYAVDDTSLFFGDITLPDGGIAKMSTATLTGSVVIAHQSNVSSIVLDETSLYWAADRTLLTATKDGTGIRPIATGLGQYVALAANGDSIYWVDDLGASVNKVNKDGGPTEILTPSGSVPYVIRVDDHYVYWAHQGGGVARVDKAGGKSMLLANGITYPAAIGLDGRYVYFADNNPAGANLYRVAK